MRISDWSSDVCSSDLQRDQRGDHDPAALAQDGRDLVAQRLAATGGHQHQRVVAAGDVVDDGGLLAAEGGVAEDLLERSEEHTSELQSLMRTSYAVFCLKKKNKSRRRQIISKLSSFKQNNTRQ